MATQRDGIRLAEIIDHLVEDATAMGISAADALDIIEQVNGGAQVHERDEIRVWYDADRAGAGVAFGNTILAFRVANASTRAIQSVSITIEHPLTQDLVTLPVINTLNKDSSKFTETDLVFERVGRHSVRAGWVEVRWLSGSTAVYRFDDTLRLNADNRDAARAHIQSITQTIQTHGGGVVSAGSPGTGDSTSGPTTSWEPVRLTVSDAAVLRDVRQNAEARRAARAPKPEAPDPIPEAPTDLTAVAQSPTSVLLTWTDNAVDEMGYQVERSADRGAFVLMATLGAESVSYVATGLVAGSRCDFRVRAINKAGASHYSNVASVALPEPVKEAPAPPPQPAAPDPVPEAPTDLTAIAQSPTSVLLTWTDNAVDEMGYQVERSADRGTFVLMATLGAESVSYVATGLVAGSRCAFRVRAINKAGASPYSNVASVALPEPVKEAPAPAPPQQIHVVVNAPPMPSPPAASVTPAPAAIAPLPAPSVATPVSTPGAPPAPPAEVRPADVKPARPVPRFAESLDPKSKGAAPQPSFLIKTAKRLGWTLLSLVVLVVVLGIAGAVMQDQERNDETARLMTLEQQIADSAKAARFASALLLLEQLAPISNAFSNSQDYERYRVEYSEKRASLRNTILELQAKYEADSAAASALALSADSSLSDSGAVGGPADTASDRGPAAFLAEYSAAYRQADTTLLAPFYADRVDYFDRGIVSRSDLLKDKGNYFARWPVVRMETDSTMAAEERLIITEPTPGFFEVEWRVLFTVSRGDETKSGRAVNHLIITTRPGLGQVIVRERSTVTARFN
jgi:hypothetical protein